MPTPDQELARRHNPLIQTLLEREPVWAKDFENLHYEWRRLFAEVLGTSFLVLIAAGMPVVSARTPGGLSRAAAVVAPGLMIAAIILFMGAVSGAHLNPAVSFGFALRGDFGWRRVPGYILAQLLGAVLASGVLRVVFGNPDHLGATIPKPEFSASQAFGMEFLLTFGLMSVILGVSSSAQNVGHLAAIGVPSYIILAGLWASPVSGASMNPARSFGPAVVGGSLHLLWIYAVAPLLGAALAVAASWVLRGPGGDKAARHAAEGNLG